MKFKSEEELTELISLFKTEALADELMDTMSWLRDITEEAEEDGGQILMSEEGGCLVCAIAYDGVPQAFFYPMPLLKRRSEKHALIMISNHCRISEITEVITAVPADRLPRVLEDVLHARIDSAGKGYYTVTVETECMLTENYPEVMYEDIYLSEPTANFAEEYKRLIMDEGVNRYTGYDVRRENPDMDASFILEEARREFALGKAVTSFATVMDANGKNLFIGEGVLYRFDGRGGAEMAVRLLPEYMGKGYGKKLAMAMIELGKQMTLNSVYALVSNENAVAIKLFNSIMTKSYDNGSNSSFYIEF